MTTEKLLTPSEGSYVEWSAILAGTVLAAAISVVLLQFGTAIGVADTQALLGDADISAGKLVGAGLFILFIQLLASLCGGYLAGRMRAPIAGATGHEREIRDGMHGLLVWATGTVAVVLAVSAAATLTALVGEPTVETERAQDIINREENIAIILAFSAAATSLVSAVASWFAATKGGDHRDRLVDHSRHFSFRRK